jgi:nitrite reductase/ring-hydroxylating ferredoxin subunit
VNTDTELSTAIVVPVVPARGIGGRHPVQPLYEAVIDGVVHVIWELGDERFAYAPALCPHRPALGPVLHTRGLVDGQNLVCTRHGNQYSGSTGECVRAEGAGPPGRLAVRFGRRVGDRFVLDAARPGAEHTDNSPTQSDRGNT